MPSYLVETFQSFQNHSERANRERRMRRAGDDLRMRGIDIRFVRSIHVPEDEICFLVVEAASAREAALAAEEAGLEPVRVVAATSCGETTHATTTASPTSLSRRPQVPIGEILAEGDSNDGQRSHPRR
jgi:hypothetical protein